MILLPASRGGYIRTSLIQKEDISSIHFLRKKHMDQAKKTNILDEHVFTIGSTGSTYMNKKQ